MVAHEFTAYAAQGFLHRGDLHQDVCTIAVFVHHLLQATNLTFDAVEAVQIAGLDLRIDGGCLARTRCDLTSADDFGRGLSGGRFHEVSLYTPSSYVNSSTS